jgi:hypothetical protein
MRYLVKARLKPGQADQLLRTIEGGTLGAGSIAGGEYIRDMNEARRLEDGSVRWVEICYCPTPLEEEIPYWEEYFELIQIKDAHDRRRCRDLNGEEFWACSTCDCTDRLEAKLASWGESFLTTLYKQTEEAKIVEIYTDKTSPCT